MSPQNPHDGSDWCRFYSKMFASMAFHLKKYDIFRQSRAYRPLKYIIWPIGLRNTFVKLKYAEHFISWCETEAEEATGINYCIWRWQFVSFVVRRVRNKNQPINNAISARIQIQSKPHWNCVDENRRETNITELNVNWMLGIGVILAIVSGAIRIFLSWTLSFLSMFELQNQIAASSHSWKKSMFRFSTAHIDGLIWLRNADCAAFQVHAL